MREKIRSKWLEYRFRKKKKIDADYEEIRDYPLRHIPLYIIDGDEDKTGDGEIEIDFADVHRENDLMVDLDKIDKEGVYISGVNKSAVYWMDAEDLPEKESFYIYYGCKHRIARLFDRFFHKDNKIDNEENFNDMCTHMPK